MLPRHRSNSVDEVRLSRRTTTLIGPRAIISAVARVTVQLFKSIRAESAVVAIRVRHFLARHGSPGTEELPEGESKGGRCGSWEIRAADGYWLRCDWVQGDDAEQLSFLELERGGELEP